jgi:hypothetical protein
MPLMDWALNKQVAAKVNPCSLVEPSLGSGCDLTIKGCPCVVA